MRSGRDCGTARYKVMISSSSSAAKNSLNEAMGGSSGGEGTEACGRAYFLGTVLLVVVFYARHGVDRPSCRSCCLRINTRHIAEIDLQAQCTNILICRSSPSLGTTGESTNVDCGGTPESSIDKLHRVYADCQGICTSRRDSLHGRIRRRRVPRVSIRQYRLASSEQLVVAATTPAISSSSGQTKSENKAAHNRSLAGAARPASACSCPAKCDT